MAKVIITVLLIVVLALYGAMFITWNTQTITVVGFVSPLSPDQGYSTVMPQAFLAIGGVIVGIVIMAIAAWSTWAAQKDTARTAQAQVAAAKKKLQERTDMVRELRGEVKKLKNEQKAAKNSAPPTDEAKKDEAGDDIV